MQIPAAPAQSQPSGASLLTRHLCNLQGAVASLNMPSAFGRVAPQTLLQGLQHPQNQAQ